MSIETKSGEAATSGFELIALAPAAFVVLWSTGFIGGKLGLPYTGPLTFLLLRFAAVLALLIPIAFLLGAVWPRSGREYFHIAVAGLLLHAGYQGGVFTALHLGMGAGVVALLVSLQPALTGVLAMVWLNDRVVGRQWLGLILGIIGVALVVADKLTLQFDQGALLAALIALASITIGTLYQKRYCPNLKLLSGAVIQYAACLAIYLVLAPTFESISVQWTGEFIFALGWLVVVLSIATIMILYLLIRRGAATQVTSLFYLVPPTTAIMAWLLLDETFTGWALAGLLICAVGVAMVVRQPRA